MDCVLKTNKPSRVSDPRKLIIEECFRRFTNQPLFSMITSLYLIGRKEPEQIYNGQPCDWHDHPVPSRRLQVECIPCRTELIQLR
jgi:hypothetical protein